MLVHIALRTLRFDGADLLPPFTTSNVVYFCQVVILRVKHFVYLSVSLAFWRLQVQTGLLNVGQLKLLI